MVFVAKTEKSDLWKIIANTISTLVEEATFNATPEGFSFRAMDPSHVALVDLSLSNALFDKYQCDKEYQLTVRVEEFTKLIKRASQKDSVSITTDDEYLIIELKNGYKRDFKIHLIESSYSPAPVPSLSLNTHIKIKEKTLENVLNDINVVADHIIIEAENGKVDFIGKSDSGEAVVTFEKNKEEIIELEIKEKSRSTYGLQYLINIVKAIGNTSEDIIMEFSDNMPLKLEFNLGEAGSKLTFYLAPRIEDN